MNEVRHLLLMKIDRNEGTVRLNFNNDNAGHLRLKEFQVRGVTQTSWLYLTLSKIATLPVSSGSSNAIQYLESSQFPLPIIVQPNNVSTYQFKEPLCIMGGDNLMTSNQEIDFRITDTNGVPAVFGDMTLLFDFIPRSQYSEVYGDRRIENKIKQNNTERRESFNPGGLANYAKDFDHLRFY